MLLSIYVIKFRVIVLIKLLNRVILNSRHLHNARELPIDMVASKKIGMMAFTKLACLLLLFYQFSLVSSISQNELNELSRKFKYYHSAVRPAAPDNFVSDRNGTFFNIPVEIHLLATRIVNVIGFSSIFAR